MYATAWRVLKANFTTLLILAVAIAVAEFSLPQGPHLILVVLCHGLFSYRTHQSALSDGSDGGFGKGLDSGDVDEPVGAWPFLWRFGAFFAVIGGTIFLVAVGVSVILYEMRANQVTPALIWTAAALVFLVVGYLLVMFGTVFPASVVGGDTGLHSAFRRGQMAFWKTVGRFLIGPCLWMIYAIALLNLGFDLIPQALNGAPAVDLAVSTAGSMIGLVNTLLIAVILTLAFRETEPAFG